MARGWGNAPPHLKGTLGTLLRTTLIQLGSLRDVAVTQLRAGGRELATRSPGLLRSRRTDVLASLGEIIYELARAGELDLDDFPELASAITELQTIDSQRRPGSEGSQGSEDLDGLKGLEGLTRFGGSEDASEDAGFVGEPVGAAQPGRVWRPDPNDYEDDGTVSALLAHPKAGQAEADTRPERMAPPARPSRRSASGHIAFVPDDVDDVDDAENAEDLAEYMHKDDVPTRE